MALDIYAGSLTRYYLRDWKNQQQETAEQNGIAYIEIRPGKQDAAPDTTDPSKFQELILDWRRDLANALELDLSWSEDPDGEYLSKRISFDSLGALLLWASYLEIPSLRNDNPDLQNWGDDAAYLEVSNTASGSAYCHLVQGTELWLPFQLDHTLYGPDTTGTDVVIGSAPELLFQLDDLNQSTWKASSDQISNWLNAGDPGADSEFESLAKFAFATMQECAKYAVDKNMPLKLDY